MTRLPQALRMFVLAVCLGMSLICVGCGKVEKADDLWDRGEKAEAVRKYKSECEPIYPLFPWSGLGIDREKMFPRIVQFELEEGNTDEARKWIKEALKRDIDVEGVCKSPASKEVFAAVKKEYEAEVEQKRQEKEAERLAKAEAAAKRKAEAAAAEKVTATKKRSRVPVSRSELGDRWPLTVESGEVEWVDEFTLVFHHGSRTYALNGMAQNRGYPSIVPIWKNNPGIPGTKINIGP